MPTTRRRSNSSSGIPAPDARTGRTPPPRKNTPTPMPTPPRFDKVLIANRGAIACRIIRSRRSRGLGSGAVYSEADADSAHVAQADQALCIGPAAAAHSYLDADRILAAARESGAGAIHPGYGFLSESPDFAEACEAAGPVFIGPTPAQMRAFGFKHQGRALAQAHGVPLLPGTGLLADLAEAVAQARRIGYPVMLKSSAGGGGIGMRLVRDAGELAAAFEAVAHLARAHFNDAGLFLEKFVEPARHIEVQLFGDGQGRVVALGERDCSAQRRNQKVIEETPAPHLAAGTRAALIDAALRLGRAGDYPSAGAGGGRGGRWWVGRCGGDGRSTPARPARWSSGWTGRASSFTFSKSTPACKSSMAWRSRSRASTWCAPWCNWG